MSTIIVNKSHSTISVGDNASYVINGDDDAILVGSADSVVANGAALSVQVSGANSVVTIGGNGEGASDANDNVVTFAGVPGALHELANARVDVHADATHLTMAGNDALGVYGEGDSVIAVGTGDGIWIGQNGATATGAARDFITGLDQGSIFELIGSSVVANGSHFSATVTSQDVLSATGAGVTVTATGAGDVVDIGGDGSGASDADEDVVRFQAAGTINVFANSRVDVTANDTHATLAGSDAFGIYGAGDVVTANGTNDALYLGQNGVNAAGAAIDVVHGLTYGTIFELQQSNVTVSGTGYGVTMNGEDTLTATGQGVVVSGTGAGNTVTIGGTGIERAALVDLSGGTVHELAQSVLQFPGDDSTLTMGQYATAEVDGGSDRVIVGPTADASITGSSEVVSLQGDDLLDIFGSGERVTDAAGGNRITIGTGSHDYMQGAADNVALNTGDAVTLRQNSIVNLTEIKPDANGDYAITLSYDDTISVKAGMEIFTPTITGSEIVHGFGPDNIMSLATHFDSVNALLAATTDGSAGAFVNLGYDSTLEFAGVSKATLATYANAGLIKFS